MNMQTCKQGVGTGLRSFQMIQKYGLRFRAQKAACLSKQALAFAFAKHTHSTTLPNPHFSGSFVCPHGQWVLFYSEGPLHNGRVLLRVRRGSCFVNPNRRWRNSNHCMRASSFLVCIEHSGYRQWKHMKFAQRAKILSLISIFFALTVLTITTWR